MASVILEGSSPRARPTRSHFYVGVALLVAAIVFVGFGPTFFDLLVRGTKRSWIVHVHGIVYVGWLALLIGQSVLAARGRIALHRRVGAFGIGYGVLVWVVGVFVSFALPVMHVTAGEWTVDRAASFLTIPLGDMTLFGGFFGAAIAYRRRPEIHKRLILLAAVAVMFAGVGRLWFDSAPLKLLVWFSPVLIAMGYDLMTRRRIHPVYWIGIAIMAVALARVPFGESELWLSVGRPIIAALA
jgi:hypothetical protein